MRRRRLLRCDGGDASDSRAHQPHPHWSSRVLERGAAAAVWLLTQGLGWRLLEWSERRGGHATACRAAAARRGAAGSTRCAAAAAALGHSLTAPRRSAGPVSLHAAERETCSRRHLTPAHQRTTTSHLPATTVLAVDSSDCHDSKRPLRWQRAPTFDKHLKRSALVLTRCARRCLSWAEVEDSLSVRLPGHGLRTSASTRVHRTLPRCPSPPSFGPLCSCCWRPPSCTSALRGRAVVAATPASPLAARTQERAADISAAPPPQRDEDLPEACACSWRTWTRRRASPRVVGSFRREGASQVRGDSDAWAWWGRRAGRAHVTCDQGCPAVPLRCTLQAVWPVQARQDGPRAAGADGKGGGLVAGLRPRSSTPAAPQQRPLRTWARGGCGVLVLSRCGELSTFFIPTTHDCTDAPHRCKKGAR